MCGVPYVWGSLSAADCAEWSGLMTVIAHHDGTEELYSAEDLAEELEDPTQDPALDTVSVRAESGELVAYGQLRRRSELVDGVSLTGIAGGVHPAHRGNLIGRELMDRLETRVRVSVDGAPDVPVVTRADAGETAADHRRFLEHRGYRVVRYFHEMVHSLDPLPDAAEGVVAPYERGLDAAVHAAHTVAFADHWGSAPLSDEEWATWGTGSRTFRPDASFVVPAADGSINGYALSHQWQPGELWIDVLGVRGPARRRGLGHALLSAVLRAASEQGYTEVGLSVDSESPTDAGRLYESMGFRVRRTFVAYRRILRDPEHH